MLNTNVNNKQNINISAVSGTIVKTHDKSYIDRFHITSQKAKSVFDGNSNIVVLQAMNSHDGYLLVEVISKKDYEQE